MKKTLIATLIAVTAALSLGTAAHAATDAQKTAAKEKWDAMTPEQKAAAKDKAKAKWDAMSPEEKAAAKKRFQERHPHAAEKMADKKAEAAPAK